MRESESSQPARERDRDSPDRRTHTVASGSLDSVDHLLKMTNTLVQLSITEMDYQVPVDALRELSGAAYVALNLYESGGTRSVTQAISGVSQAICRASEMLGFQLVGKGWDIIPHRLRSIQGGKLVRFDSLHETCMGALSKPTADLIQNAFGIGPVYVIEMVSRDGKTMGDIILFLKKGTAIRNAGAVELYAGYLGSIIEKLLTDQELLKRESALKILVHQQEVILDNVDVQVWHYTDPETLGAINQRHASFLGVGKGYLKGTTIWDLYETREEALACLSRNRAAFEEKKQVRTEEWVTGRSGYRRLFSVTRTPRLDQEGRVEYVICSAIDITDRKEAEERLRHSEEKHRLLVENSHDIIYTLTPEGIFTFVSPAWTEILGHQVQEISGRPFRVFVHEEDLDSCYKFLDRVVRTGRRQKGVEYRVRHADGSWRWHTSSAVPMVNDEGQVTGFQGVARDITPEKEARESLQRQLIFERMVSHISSMIMSLPSSRLDEGIREALRSSGEFFQVDRSYLFEFSSDGSTMSNTHEWCAPGIEPQLGRVQGFPVDELPWWRDQIRTQDYVHIPEVEALPPEAAAERQEFEAQEIKSLLCIPVMMEGELAGFMGFDAVRRKAAWTGDQIALLRILAELLSNARERWRTEERIRYLSFHDELTGLYNRRYLEEEMRRLSTSRQLPLSVIMADLNGLKLVNDTYGHGTGDKMLQKAAEILAQSCRREDLVARWGGDEFVILLPRTSREETEDICGRISGRCRDSEVGDVPITMALGFSTRHDSGISPEEMLQEAEDHMYRHKLEQSRSTKSAALRALLTSLESKSFETRIHSERMSRLAAAMGHGLGLPESEMRRLDLLVWLHDIGKIEIPGDILTKPGPLTSQEWEIVRKHPQVGYKITRATGEFAHVSEEILAHHEQWDGSGYPSGLVGKKIPLLSRILALVDAYEVMTVGRPYRKALGLHEAVSEIRRLSGEQFDPELVEVFLEIILEARKETDDPA